MIVRSIFYVATIDKLHKIIHLPPSTSSQSSSIASYLACRLNAICRYLSTRRLFTISVGCFMTDACWEFSGRRLGNNKAVKSGFKKLRNIDLSAYRETTCSRLKRVSVCVTRPYKTLSTLRQYPAILANYSLPNCIISK